VLAIAVLGIVMVKAFSSRLELNLSRLAVPSTALRELRADEIKLAGLPVPAGLDQNLKMAVKRSIDEAFVFGFRIVVLICAGLSLASAAVAGFMIRPVADISKHSRRI
jgi:hypothetical protein